jgi:hypothetical protein
LLARRSRLSQVRRRAPHSKKADPMAMISTYLRASKEIDNKTAEAVENIIQVAWKNLKQS